MMRAFEWMRDWGVVTRLHIAYRVAPSFARPAMIAGIETEAARIRREIDAETRRIANKLADDAV